LLSGRGGGSGGVKIKNKLEWRGRKGERRREWGRKERRKKSRGESTGSGRGGGKRMGAGVIFSSWGIYIGRNIYISTFSSS
jgi:hypothetical protein